MQYEGWFLLLAIIATVAMVDMALRLNLVLRQLQRIRELLATGVDVEAVRSARGGRARSIE